MSTTRPNTSTKEAREEKIGLYLALFVTELYIFLIFLEIVNIVPLNTKDVYIPPSEMLLRTQGRITSCTKLSGLSDIKVKIEIQVSKTYIYPLFRVLSTTTAASEN